MSRITQALSIATALLSGGVYDTASANAARPTTANAPIVQTIDSNDENLRIMMDARIAMGTELRKR